jgi:Zn-finger nucleic acid-binding protein
MLVGAKFCSHCGASTVRAEVTDDDKYLCPRCQVGMKAIMIGNCNLRECPHCEGMWTDVDALQQICTEQEKQAAVLGMPAPPSEPVGLEKNIRYLPCPVCRKLMNRVNFAHCSQVVLDVCKAHGTWFDKDELRRTVEFIRAGGMEKARDYQVAQMEDERRRLEAARNAVVLHDLDQSSSSNRDRQSGLIADFVRSLLG